ncbi:MAG: bifunctional precorrin-2 dehydrogenase/sirohydrochlorin ferrochelatase [Candidatus Lambdaproteobacteria bacterium]|nr:bifunctional precorrin-2 dehydrogenase/sirohydrochlorin ferrochelatase [Candidatus Lambdaproteobacteria bacterium]
MPTSELYPVFLKLRDRPVLIVGGGALALQKARTLDATGARVRVVAPALDPALLAAAEAGRITVARRAYCPEDLTGAALVFAATDDGALNHRIVAEAEARGILANAVDDPDHCAFYTPAVVRHPAATLALSTGGAFPGLARALRECLDAWLPPGDAELHAALVALRRRLRRELDPAARREALAALIAGVKARYLLATGRDGEGRERAPGAGTARDHTETASEVGPAAGSAGRSEGPAIDTIAANTA